MPWLVAHSNIYDSHSPIRSFIKRVKNAEVYLRDVHPGVQIPQDLLTEHLRDSVKQTDRSFDPYQAELLGLGVTRFFPDGATRQKLPSRWNEYFVAFPSGTMRSNISIPRSEAVGNFRCGINTVEDQGGSRRRNKSTMFGRDIYS